MSATETLSVLSSVAQLMDRSPRGLFNSLQFRPDLITACRDLCSAARTLERWAVLQCNGINRYQGNGIYCATWTEADEAAKDKAQAKAEAKAMIALGLIFGHDLQGVEIEFQRDPRGHMVKVWPKGKRDHGSPLMSL